MINVYPVAEVAPGVFEIDEFDCDDVFVVKGSKRALVMDTGIGIGDIRAAVERIIGDLPYDVVVSHGHSDHMGGAGAFDVIYENPVDFDLYPFPVEPEGRARYAGFISQRSGLEYPYDPKEDIVEWKKVPERKPRTDGMVFDLGDRKVTAYSCPGHTPGEMVFVDDKSRILFAGDAINGNLLFGSVPPDPRFTSVETAYKGLQRIAALGSFDKIFNFHHDYRPFGEPLSDRMLPDVLEACRQLVTGEYEAKTVPGMFPGQPDRTVVIVGDAMITFRAEGIHDPE